MKDGSRVAGGLEQQIRSFVRPAERGSGNSMTWRAEMRFEKLWLDTFL